MADTCSECLCCRDAIRGQTEPIMRRHAQEDIDEDSSYHPSGHTELSLSFSATATSRARSGSQPTPSHALAMAQELLRYQPTETGREGWLARIAELVNIAGSAPMPSCSLAPPPQEGALVGQIAHGGPPPPPRPLVLRVIYAIQDIAEAGRNARVAGTPTYNAGCLALIKGMRYVTWPDKFRHELPLHYDGSTNPLEFLQLYTVGIQAVCGDHRVMANWFPMALKEAARAWLMNLPTESISSWEDLCKQFVSNFMATYERPASKNDLKADEGEALHKRRSDRCTKAEEGRLFVHDAPEAAPASPLAKNKSKETKRKKPAILATEPEQKHRYEDRAKGNKDDRPYCILHKKHTHNTEDCYELKKFHEEQADSKKRGNGRGYGRGGGRGGGHFGGRGEYNQQEGYQQPPP
ncbi:hypothetical protein ACQ4PT_064686 [Festuca glaucescens]